LIGWLIYPHLMMVKARDEAVEPLAQAYEQALLQGITHVEEDTKHLIPATRRIVTLKERYYLALTPSQPGLSR